MKSQNDLTETYNLQKGVSLSARMRIRRFQRINEIVSSIISRKGNCRVLDVGGSEYYWNLNRGFLDANKARLHITITNLDEREVQGKGGDFSYKIGDATTPALYEGDYDFVHSNSVIEHVGPWPKIRAMADCIVATKGAYYLQTPNYWFPVEPHFRTIGFQWLPIDVRARMLIAKQRGFRSATTYDGAMDQIESVNLLTKNQMKQLFPDAEIAYEWFGPFVKSLMAIRV